MTALLVVALAISAVSATKRCASLLASTSASQSDPTPITVGGGAFDNGNSALFMSGWFAYLVTVGKTGLSVQQASMGKFQVSLCFFYF